MVIVFDVDGTLVDTYPLVKASYLHAVNKYLPNYQLTETKIKSFFGPPLPQTFIEISNDETLVQEMMETYQVFSNKNAREYLRLFPNTKETLIELKNMGYTLVILSNKIQDAIRIELEIMGILEFFDLIIGYTDVKNPKPHPEGIFKIKDIYKDDCIFVGDTTYDIETAKNAQIKSVGVTWALTPESQLIKAGADYTIKDFKELINIVRCL